MFRDRTRKGKSKERKKYVEQQISLPRYFGTHRKSFFIVLILSLIITAAFTVSILYASYKLFGGDATLTQTLADKDIQIASNVGNAAANFTDMLMNLIWAFVFLWIPVFVIFYWISMFAVRPKFKKDMKQPERQRALVAALRWVIGFALLWFVMRYNATYFNDVANEYINGESGAYIHWCLAWIAFILPVTDWRHFMKWKRARVMDRYQWLVKPAEIILVSVLCFFVLEYQCGSKTNVIENMKGFNICYWIILQVFFYILFRSVKPGAVISIVCAWFIGFANYLVMQFRGNYIMFGDLTVVRTALSVADNYKLKLDHYFYISLLVALAGIVIVLLLRNVRSEKKQTGKTRAITTAVGEAVMVTGVIVLFITGALYGGIFGVAWDYNTNVTYNGYIPYFMSNANSVNSITLKNYSADKAKKAVDSGAVSYDKTAAKQTHVGVKDSKGKYVEPNIIIIQNEAFSDLAVTADIKTNIDYMPYIRSLTKNTQKGYMNMSITGGPTANSEFETLMRCTMAFMPYGSVPFTQYLKSKVPSMIETLKAQKTEYKTIGFHPYYSSGYTRKSVYELLGFDGTLFYDKTSQLRGKEKIRGMVSDSQDYKDVEKMYETKGDSPLFVFNVTIQNHGGYTKNTYKFREPVRVTNFDAADSINTYLSLIKESDNAFKELTEYFEKQDEPTIIFMYGDHQPSFDSSAKSQLESHPAYKSSDLQTLSKYYVPYVMWANYDIDEKDDMNSGGTSGSFGKLSLEYVPSLIFENAGLRLTDYDKYLLDLHSDVPALTALGYWTKDGTKYSLDDKSSSGYKAVEAYRQVQYNLLFDKHDKLDNEFGVK